MKQFIVTVVLPKEDSGRQGLATILTPAGYVERRDIFASDTDLASKTGWAARLISTMFPVAGSVHGDSLYESIHLNGGLVCIWIVDVEEELS